MGFYFLAKLLIYFNVAYFIAFETDICCMNFNILDISSPLAIEIENPTLYRALSDVKTVHSVLDDKILVFHIFRLFHFSAVES